MSTLAIVLIVVGALLLVLILGGLIVVNRRRRLDASKLQAQLEEANEALAQAHAQDKGWERGGLEAAVRDVFATRSPQAVRELQLVQVVDRPGTDEDRAVFRVVTDDGAHEVELTRRGDSWLAE